ncbi:MAG: putative MATE family efflux protein [Myxococcota bacterium]|jgi:putative MATE family efflux protein
MVAPPPPALLPLGICPTSLRRLVSLAAPVVGLNVLTVLSLAVDTAMLGRLPDAATALTGMGFAAQIVFLLMTAVIGLTVGSVAFVARAHGTGEHDRVTVLVGQACLLAVGLGLVAAVVGNVLAQPLLVGLGAGPADLDAGLAYLRPMLAGASLNYLGIMLGAVLRGVGNTRLAFGVAVAANAVNFIANYTLILGNFGFPALGIQGAAFGTLISQAVTCVLLVGFVGTGRVHGINLPRRWPGVHFAPDLARVGWPAALDMLILNAGFLTIIGLLGRIDPLAVAAHGIGIRIQALAFVPGMAISQATGALVGQSLGRADVDEAWRILRSSVALCFVVMTTLGILIMLGRTSILMLFDVQPGTELGDYAEQWILLLGTCMPFVGAYIACVGTFQGSGATRTSLRINAAATLLAQIPLSWFLGITLGLGTFGVWVAFPLSFVVKLIWGGIEVRRGAWATVGARV